MIRFACPSCQNVLEVSPDKGGTKMHCGRCNQRLQVPTPAIQNKTVMGNLMGGNGGQAVMAAPRAAVQKSAAKESMWFYVRNGQRQGPVPAGQLATLYQGGQVRGTDLVWTDGMTNWQPAKAVASRFAPEPEPLALSSISHRGSVRTKSPQPSRLPKSLLIGGAAGGFLSLMAMGTFIVFLLLRKPEPGVTVQAAQTNPTTPAPDPNAELSTVDLVAKCEPSVALIRGASGGFGSGFIVEKDLLVTNSHVVRGDPVQGLKIYFPSAPGGKTPITGELVYEDVKRDIAILRIKTTLPALDVAETFTFKKGQRIVIIGSPGADASSSGATVALENAVSEGKMSTETTLDEMPFYQVSATVNPGNSGGPMFDGKGRIIGVVVRKAVGDRQEGMGFIIPLPDLQKAISVVKNQNADDATKTAARHDRRATYLYCGELGDLQKKLIATIHSNMKAADAAGKGALTGHRETLEKPKIKEIVGVTDGMLETLRLSIPQVNGDPELKPGVAAKLESLLRNLDSMNRLIHNPETVGFNRYASEANKLFNEFDTLMAALVPLIRDELK